ncbi:MAG TPA: hypothetical protein VKU89_11340 [Solirubrobacteraceae bacterium]|nr:hypothetical protein [Solirubrobacteraceae bacterium]
MSWDLDRLKPLAAALALALGAAVALAACGGSSAARAARTTVAATDALGGSGQLGARSGRYAALRECMAKNGISLPASPHANGTRPGASGLFGQSHLHQHALQPPAGVSQSVFEAALRRCRADAPGRSAARADALALLKSAAFKKRLDEFATCMRSHGIALGAPNTSGKGSIFATRGLDTASAAFRSAVTSCRADLGSELGAERSSGG